jgi:hypothetical protein
MPQLDPLVLSTQTAFVVVFWLGYFLFIKTLLPLISMEMKIRQKRILTNMLWFKQNLPKTIFFRLPFGKLLVRTRGILNIVDLIVLRKKIFFGIYPVDLLYIKHRHTMK